MSATFQDGARFSRMNPIFYSPAQRQTNSYRLREPRCQTGQNFTLARALYMEGAIFFARRSRHPRSDETGFPTCWWHRFPTCVGTVLELCHSENREEKVSVPCGEELAGRRRRGWLGACLRLLFCRRHVGSPAAKSSPPRRGIVPGYASGKRPRLCAVVRCSRRVRPTQAAAGPVGAAVDGTVSGGPRAVESTNAGLCPAGLCRACSTLSVAASFVAARDGFLHCGVG